MGQAVQVLDNVARPNVIWILLDACRAESLGCYGYERATSPVLDGLAREGVLFTRHFSQASKTYQSVPSFMTGRYFPAPCFSKRYSQTIFDVTPPQDEKMLGEIMRENGYKTAMFTNMPLFLKDDRLSKSFDEAFIWKQGERVLLQRWTVMTEEMNSWLKAAAGSPFFLYVHAADTHFPHEMVPPYDQWMDAEYDTERLNPMGYGQNYTRRDGKPFDEADREYLRGYYDGMIKDADDRIGELLEQLSQLNLLNNTLIIVSADHGQLIGEDGFTVAHAGGTDQVLKVPLVMRGPGIPRGMQVDALTENVDIVPTLVDLLGLKTHARFDGLSLRAVYAGAPPGDWRTHAFAVPERDTYETPVYFAFRGPEFKYEFTMDGKLAKVFKSPDRAESRVEVSDSQTPGGPELEEQLSRRFLPALKAMQSLPVTSVMLEGASLASKADPPSGVEDYYISGERSSEALERDNKWAFTDGFLWANNTVEDVPALSYRFAVPNGCYNGRINMWNSLFFMGKPSSSVVLKFESDPVERHIVSSSLPETDAAVTPVPLGCVKIESGFLCFTLSAGDKSYWTRIHSIELIPCGIDQNNAVGTPSVPTLNPEDAAEQHKNILDAGYM